MAEEKSMLDYFNLESRARAGLERAPKLTEAHLSIIRQLIMYVGVFIGILFSTAVSQFETGETITLTMNVTRILVSAVIALMVVPQVYQRLNPETPFIVQFGLFVQNGVFWSVLIDLIRKTL